MWASYQGSVDKGPRNIDQGSKGVDQGSWKFMPTFRARVIDVMSMICVG